MSAPLRLATIGSRRPGALLVEVELRDERLGGDWAINDWRALR